MSLYFSTNTFISWGLVIKYQLNLSREILIFNIYFYYFQLLYNSSEYYRILIYISTPFLLINSNKVPNFAPRKDKQTSKLNYDLAPLLRSVRIDQLIYRPMSVSSLINTKNTFSYVSWQWGCLTTSHSVGHSEVI